MQASRFQVVYPALRVASFSHTSLLSLSSPAAQNAPHGLTLPPAFCRMPA